MANCDDSAAPAVKQKNLANFVKKKKKNTMKRLKAWMKYPCANRSILPLKIRS